MKRVLYLTNIASPYRVHFFDLLGKEMEVTVLFSDSAEETTDRNAAWFEQGQGGFRGVQLKRLIRIRNENLCLNVMKWMKKDYDVIIIGGYSSPTAILAMLYLRLRGIPFYMEVDGGLIRSDSWLKGMVKRTLISLPDGWLSTGPATTDYLVHYGAKRERVYEYPFSSIHQQDMLEQVVTREEKLALRRELGVKSENMILSIGQFIHRKGFDILLKAAVRLPEGADIYIVGGEPTEEYRTLCRELDLHNVHFVGFLKKERLAQFYMAADLFVLPTREDIWGLVVNEAMAYGLPVITTDRCVAGLSLVEDAVSGYIIPSEDVDALAGKIALALSGDCAAMGAAALEQIRPYTIEQMTRVHVEILEGLGTSCT